MTLPRHDGRSESDLRPVTLEPNWLRAALGSALITVGDTRVLCAVTLEDRVPPHLKDSGEGWVTGEYAMLPASGNVRTPRESVKGRPSGRTMEIQRLIGRCLRSVVDRVALGPRTLWVDCDVLQADGGTRTASITGAYVALALAVARLRDKRTIASPVLTAQLAAVSVGVVEGRAVADLDYIEDAAAEVDMNVVRTGDGRYVELQGTAETTPFRKDRLDALLALADDAIDRLMIVQRDVLGDALAKAVQKRS